jgi:uncharacterized membrane protein
VENQGAILLWWFLFAGTHIGGSSLPVRNWFCARFGLPIFKGIYSLVALATFIPLCYVYFNNKHAGLQLFKAGYGLQMTTQVLMLLAFIVLGQSLVTTSPMTTLAEMTGRYRGRARGIQRVTRHPQNFAFALFGFAHLLSNPYAGDWIFFGGFIVYGILSAFHQDRRTLTTGPQEVELFQAETSLMPFRAILTGKQRLAVSEYNRVALVVAILCFVVVRFLHGKLFGGFGA